MRPFHSYSLFTSTRYGCNGRLKKYNFSKNLHENMANMAAGTSVSCKPAICHFRNEEETGPSKDFWERYRRRAGQLLAFFPLFPLTVPVVPEVFRAASVCGGKKDRGTGFSVLAVRELKREPKNKTEGGGWLGLLSHFRAMFDSRSSFFAAKPNGNACYAGDPRLSQKFPEVFTRPSLLVSKVTNENNFAFTHKFTSFSCHVVGTRPRLD